MAVRYGQIYLSNSGLQMGILQWNIFQIHHYHILSLVWQLQLLSQLPSCAVCLKQEACWTSQVQEHPLLKISTSRRYYICCHNPLGHKGTKISTTFKCGSCDIPLCNIMNILNGILKKLGLAKASRPKADIWVTWHFIR